MAHKGSVKLKTLSCTASSRKVQKGGQIEAEPAVAFPFHFDTFGGDFALLCLSDKTVQIV